MFVFIKIEEEGFRKILWGSNIVAIIMEVLDNKGKDLDKIMIGKVREVWVGEAVNLPLNMALIRKDSKIFKV